MLFEGGIETSDGRVFPLFEFKEGGYSHAAKFFFIVMIAKNQSHLTDGCIKLIGQSQGRWNSRSDSAEHLHNPFFLFWW
jgi:hypothetical protein